MRIFLVRHGMSQSNEDWGVNTRVADHAIGLTDSGKAQAGKAGEFLAEYFKDHLVEGGHRRSILEKFVDRDVSDHDLLRPKIRLWLSPYLRTRQTADGIEQHCRVPGDLTLTRPSWAKLSGDSWFMDRREHLLLAEQQFGVFDGLSDAEREEFYPREQAYYEKCKKFEGKLWPKMPLGESRFEVCQRVHQSFGSFKRDEERHGIKNIVVVGHGTTNRAFTMMWLHLPYEWMHTEPNPKNCSIRLIEDGEDKGYIFAGFDNPAGYKHKTNKETEE
jgi:2,3-bisphosphoglycerate-dependent phosphoglycerate mutase